MLRDSDFWIGLAWRILVIGILGLIGGVIGGVIGTYLGQVYITAIAGACLGVRIGFLIFNAFP